MAKPRPPPRTPALLRAVERIRREGPEYAEKRARHLMQQKSIVEKANGLHYQREFNLILERQRHMSPMLEAAEIKARAAREFERVHPKRKLPK